MEDWEEAHIRTNLSKLIHVTNCNVELLACLNQIFTEHEIESVKCERTSQEKADTLYKTVMQKVNGYYRLARAFQASKQSGALEIILDGYELNNKPIPIGLNRISLPPRERSQASKIFDQSAAKFGNHEGSSKADEKKFIWQGKLVTMKELLGKDNLEQSSDIKKERKETETPATPIIKDQLTPPVQPAYYVPRTLSYVFSTELDSAIFLSEFTKDHVFLFKGISKPELAELTCYQAIEVSGDQLNNVTVRFIMLMCDKDYDRICKNTSKPVHVIQQTEDSRYFWVKSSKRLDVIQQFLKEPRKHISEQDLVAKIVSTDSPCAFSIADSPGMGKSLVLANLANKIQQEQHAIVLFIVLQELVQQLGPVESNFSATDAIAAYSSYDHTAKLILTEMLKSELHQLYLFLDGYDEVMQDKVEVLASYLTHFQELQNIKVIVTTRPHLKMHLELLFNKFSYEIRPFNEANKIEFLTTYWKDQYEAKEPVYLKEFARQCLTALETKFTDDEKDIAGIPLQCMMLGEVYAEDALRVCNLKSLTSNEVKSISFFEMYKKATELKFKKISDQKLRKACIHVHVSLAIELLFPDWTKKFKSILSQGQDEIDQTTLYSIGLVEHSSNKPRFIHRTFAEYLLAEFIVSNLGTHNHCVDLLFGEILGRKGIILEDDHFPKLPNYKLKYPVIGYFIDMHLEEHSIDKLASSNYFPSKNFTVEDVCVTVQTCCSNDHENLFNYATKVLHHHFNVEEQLRDQYFKDIVHVVVQSCKNFKMLDKVLKLMKLKFGVDLSYHVRKSSQIDFTPLHTAAYVGKYSMAAFLVQQYGDEVRQLEHLMHACVFDSAGNSDSVIEEKILIMNMIAAINPNSIEEKLKEEDNYAPILQFNVHLSLLRHLVELGADINAHSSFHGTVLHASNDKKTYTDRIRWAISNGFKLINHKDRNDRTPLMHAIKEFGTLEDELLKIFDKKGADLNAEDKQGNSVLFFALQYSGKVSFIRKLIRYRADVNHKNKKKQNALHKIMQMSGSTELLNDMLARINRRCINEWDDEGCTPLLRHNCDLRLLQCLLHHGANINAYSWKHGTVLHVTKNRKAFAEVARWAFSNGFNRVNHIAGWNKRTPLMHALKEFGYVDDDVMEMFLKAGTDFNAQDKHGDSVLFYALEWVGGNQHYHFLKKLLEYGVDVNHKNESTQNAAHKVILNWMLDCHQRISALKLLKSKGFDKFNEKDSDGCTPVSLARRKRNMDAELVEFLRSKSNSIAYNGQGSLQRARCFAKSTPSLCSNQDLA